MDEHNSLSQEGPDEELPAENSRCSKINLKLLPYKSFYFLFFSAVGSLFPYLAIFYKQLWLSAWQTGVLIGIRPILQLVSSTSWGIVADKSDKSKYIFLTSLIGWLCANFSLSLVEHKADIGPCRDNGSLTILDNAFGVVAGGPFLRNQTFYKTNMEKALGANIDRHRVKRKNFHSQLKPKKSTANEYNRTWNELISKVKSTFDNGMIKRKIDEHSSIGHPPWSLHAMLNLKMSDNTEINQKNHVIFLILLIITIVGTLVAAPAIPFADTATLQALGDQKDSYGKQRLWGAIGWGISSFVVGSVITTVQEKSRCNIPNHVNYQPCFYTFALLMVFSFIPALFIRLEDRNLPATENLTVRLRTIMNFDSIVFLLIIQQFGNSWGLVQTFLLWHLQDLGGTQFLFSIIAAVQCLSEVLSYHIAGSAITKFGYYRVLYIGLLFSSVRFIFYAIIKNPWLVVPMEMFHGVSTTLIWALAVSFIGLNTGVATTMQGILSGIHWGLGLGGGAIFGGVLVNAFGSKYAFLGYGIFSFLNFLGFVLTRKLKSCVQPTEENQSLLGSNSHEEVELHSVEAENLPASGGIH